MIHLEQLIPWLIHYKYLVIFPIAVVEGPIITIISGFLASLGYFNFLIAYGLIVLADLVGDSLYYLLGRFGRGKLVLKYGRFVGINSNRLLELEKHFEQHPNKTFIIGKAAHGIGTLVLVAAGIAKVPFRKLITANVIPTAVKSLLLFLVGFYFGKAYVKLNSYLNYASLVMAGLAILAILIYIIIWRIRKHYDRVLKL